MGPDSAARSCAVALNTPPVVSQSTASHPWRRPRRKPRTVARAGFRVWRKRSLSVEGLGTAIKTVPIALYHDPTPNGTTLAPQSCAVATRGPEGLPYPSGLHYPTHSDKLADLAHPLACQERIISDARKARAVADTFARPPQRINPRLPRYVHACEHDQWTLKLRHPVTGQTKAVRFRCRSRHHEGRCRDHWRHLLYSRLRDGRLARQLDCQNVVFLTLTLSREWHARVSRSSREAAHKLATLELGRWLDALNAVERRAGRPILEYFWVIEETKRGVCHIHMIVISEALANECRANPIPPRGDYQPAPERWTTLAQSSQLFGIIDASIARSKGAVSGYVTKVLSRVAGELSKATQSPECLPYHQRTFGASRGFLAPRVTTDWTGELENEAGQILTGRGRTEQAKRATLSTMVAEWLARSSASPAAQALASDWLAYRETSRRKYQLRPFSFPGISSVPLPQCPETRPACHPSPPPRGSPKTTDPVRPP